MRLDRALSQLTYQLVYPGVLGSMIFDLADPFRGITIVWFCSFFIALCFVVDYLHLTLNLLPNGQPTYWLQPLFDLIIALLFCLSYFALARNSTADDSIRDQFDHVFVCLFLLWVAHSIIFLYDLALHQIKNILDIIPLSISTAAVAILIYFGREFEIPSGIITKLNLTPALAEDNKFVLIALAATSAVFVSYFVRLIFIDFQWQPRKEVA